MDRENALRILQGQNPQLTEQRFTDLFRRWRNELRSPFHGGRVVTGRMREEMLNAMDMFVPAVERTVRNQGGFQWAFPGRHPLDGLVQVNMHHFVEFTTDPNLEFAENTPDAPGVSLAVRNYEENRDFTVLDWEQSNDW